MHIGIDPAPAKPTVICTNGTSFAHIEARALPDYIADTLAAHPNLLIAWDAPLSFDAANGYSDRPVDKRVRAWVKTQIKAGRLAPGAVSVLPFAGCPHWAISCAALGLPFGAKTARGLSLTNTPGATGHRIIEVHPAVALARWWVQASAATTLPALPKYKGVNKPTQRAAIATICEGLHSLGIPEQATVDDDHLDAWVAWRLAVDFDEGSAKWEGSPVTGGYVLPSA